jgi:hypothetical protein
MEYAVKYPAAYDFPISTLIWGALIFIGLFVICLLIGKAIGWLRNRWTVQVEGHIEIPQDPSERWASQAISRPSGDYYGDELGGFGGMSQREQEEFFSTYAPRKVRRVMRARCRSRAKRVDDDK